MTDVFTVPCVFELPHFSFNASQANQLRAQHALSRCVCAAMNVPLESPFGAVRVVFVSRAGEHTDRDLVRRAVDTAVAALLPPVDPALVSTAFESAPERAPAGTGGVQQTLTIDIDVAATRWKAPQFSVCGRVFYFNIHESSDGGSERVCAGIGEYGWNTAQEQLGALLKAAGKRRRHAFTSEAWNAAADAVRTLYPRKGNKDVLLEPSGIAIPGAAVVGFCARYLYVAVRADDNAGAAGGGGGGVRFHVVAKAPHGGDVDSWRDSDAASASSLLRSPPTAWLSFADASLRAGGGSGGASTSSPPQWFRTPEHVARVDLVAHRVIREGASRFQLEDCYAACFLNDGSGGGDCATVARLTEAVELLFRRSTEELEAQLKREGRSTARGKVLKHLSDPAFAFPFASAKARRAAEAFVERLFCAVTGLPAGGSNVRTLSAFAAPQQQQQQQHKPRQQQNSSSSSSSDDDGDGDGDMAVKQQSGPQRARLVQPEETQFVEFKQQLHRWQNDDDASDDGAAANNKIGGGKQHQSHANTERARRILAAFANTKGGVLFVGVSDAGELVGIPDSSERGVKDALPRATGFIPGMDSQAGVVHVQIKLQGQQRTFSSANLLAIHTPGSAAGPGGDSVLRNFAPGAQRGTQHSQQMQPEAGRPSPMVGQWWVRGGFAPAAAPAASIPQPKSVITQAGTRRQLTPPPAERDPQSQLSQLSSQMPLMTTLGFTPPAPLTQQGSASQQLQQQQAVEETRSVHAMRVMRGAAPFYCTPGMAAPPVRGQASTLALSVVSMTERIAQFLLQNAAEYPLPPPPTPNAAAAGAVGAGARRARDE